MIQVDSLREKQITYLGLTEHDVSYLHEQRNHFAAITEQVVDQLYDFILTQPQLAAIINKHSNIERLKQTQRWYFMTLADGRIDEEFIAKRLEIGKIHSRIGLTTDWYLGTYMRYLDISVQQLRRIAPEQWVDIILSLSKMFNFDSQLVLEAYQQQEQNKVQLLYEERQLTITKVTEAVQKLVAMMAELSANSQTVSDSALNTAHIQEKAHEKVSALQLKIGEVNQMGELLQEISDRTHLLGLNAAIEAAHAGSYGSGFSIVANEIRKLAAHSRTSLDTIKDTLAEITAILAGIMQDADETSQLAKDQAASSQELATFTNIIAAITQELEQIR